MSKEEFWHWFDQNKSLLEKLISKKDNDYEVYEVLTDKLKSYSKHLIPELTMTKEDKFVLVISCDGIKEGIPYADRLTENLRSFDNWEIVKFRQPSPMELIPINGLNLKRNSIFLDWQSKSPEKYDITFYIKGYSPDNKTYIMGTFLHLDHTIGEYNTMTRVGNIEFKKLGLFQSKKGLKTLDEFKTELDSNPA